MRFDSPEATVAEIAQGVRGGDVTALAVIQASPM